MSVRLALALVLLLPTGTAAAAPTSPRPSERGCLLAWNARANRSNQSRLVRTRPARVSLLPGVVSTDSWSAGSRGRHTEAAACVLTISRRGWVEVVRGLWKSGRVGRWSFGPRILTAKPLAANVRLLRDGRVTKIYRR